MAQVTCRVRRTDALICVVIGGRLDLASVASLRATLLKCLADSPAAVIVDLSRAEIVELSALSVFPAVRQHAAAWPLVPLLLSGLDRDVVPPQSRRLWVGDLPVYDDLRAAKDAASRPDLLLRRVHAWLPATADAPAQARELLSMACAAWDLEHLLPAGEVIVSELASNAICHTSGGARLTIVRGDRYLHLVVRDRDRRLPVLAEDWDAASAHGRGLRMIQALASSWGAKPTADGKTVWATLALQPVASAGRSHR
jgi:anti-anti-sigma regulatory factor